jgi:hypothetical protein
MVWNVIDQIKVTFCHLNNKKENEVGKLYDLKQITGLLRQILYIKLFHEQLNFNSVLLVDATRAMLKSSKSDQI